MAVPGLEKYWGTETFVTEALTQEAIKALNKAKNTISLFICIWLNMLSMFL